jgi:hypothetical protein
LAFRRAPNPGELQPVRHNLKIFESNRVTVKSIVSADGVEQNWMILV